MAGTKTVSNRDFSGLKGVNVADGTAATDVGAKGQIDAAQTAAQSRANHTGTQTASTISDFDTQVRTTRLDQLAAPTGPLSLNNQRGTNTAAATTDTDIAQWGQVKDLISGRRKADVRVAVTTNVSLAAPGSSLDGQTIAAGDANKRILLTGQTAPAENGIYDWNGAAVALTRASDADAAAEFGQAWLVSATTGTAQGDTVWQHTTDGIITLGTTGLTFNKIGPIAQITDGYTTTCPATAAGGSWVVPHNLNTRYLVAQLARVASPYDLVDVRIERTSLNTITVAPDAALAAGEYEIMIKRVV